MRENRSLEARPGRLDCHEIDGHRHIWRNDRPAAGLAPYCQTFLLDVDLPAVWPVVLYLDQAVRWRRVDGRLDAREIAFPILPDRDEPAEIGNYLLHLRK